MITFRKDFKLDKQGAVILVTKEQVESKRFNFSNKDLREVILNLNKNEQFLGQEGQSFPVLLKKSLIVFVGVGEEKNLSLTALRIAIRRVLLSSFLAKVKDVEIIPHQDSETVVQAIVEGVLIGTYVWKKYKTQDPKNKTVDEKNVWIAAAPKKSYEETIKICEGVNLARNLINENADIATSSLVESTIRALIRGQKNSSIEVLGRKEMKAKGLGLHLAVNQGSRNEPRLLIVKYSGGAKNESYTALVGKGITFDTGGLNLKPTGYIETMRADMSGCAAVIGTLKNTLALGLKKNIIFAVAVAENVIGSGAFKPGDVFKGYSGKTVEIGNTDAEGRLVLADALAYVVKNYKPKEIVDIATLTGACVVALGNDISGLMSNNDGFADKLLQSANSTDDRAWRLPIYAELKNYIKSHNADIKNTSSIKGAGGAITAGEFLRQFVGDTKWSHLDIAGTAFVDGPERLYYGYGGTGASIRLLTDYLKRN